MHEPITTVLGLDDAATLVGGTAPPPVAPTLVTVTPSTLATPSSTILSLAGSGFSVGLAGGPPLVLLAGASGITLGPPTVVSDTQIGIMATVAPTAAPGARTIRVQTDGGTTAALTLTVSAAPTAPAPTIAAITPGFLDIPSTTTLVITGSGFSVGYAGGPPLLFLSGAPGMTLGTPTVIDDTEMEVVASVVLGATPGQRTIRVQTDDGISNSMWVQVGSTAALNPYRMVPRYKRPT